MVSKKMLCGLMVGMMMVPGLAWGALSHVMSDPGTAQVFSDDFEDGSYTDNWVTYTNASAASFSETDGYLQAQIATGEKYRYADFFSKNNLDVSGTTGKKTEVVMSLNNKSLYTANRTLLLNTQNPFGKGFCIEHTSFPNGRIQLSLCNNEGMTNLYDSGNMSGYQYAHSFDLIVDPKTGDWSFGWASGTDGVTATQASGTLTPAQISTYLASPLYIGTGIYTESWPNTEYNYSQTYDVAVYQVPEPATMGLLGLGGLLLRRRR